MMTDTKREQSQICLLKTSGGPKAEKGGQCQIKYNVL